MFGYTTYQDLTRFRQTRRLNQAKLDLRLKPSPGHRLRLRPRHKFRGQPLPNRFANQNVVIDDENARHDQYSTPHYRVGGRRGVEMYTKATRTEVRTR
jgi:hypothetical protein